MSLNGQWIARYRGTNAGLLIVELDDLGDHYEGSGVLFDDNQELLSSIMKISNRLEGNNRENRGRSHRIVR